MLQVFHYVNESLDNQLEKGHLKDMQEKSFLVSLNIWELPLRCEQL